ncbi:hypothetical protein FD04_GL000317 [Secundilactobacillus odoratitofui DSM 19909 = JCM 15043]|uniref:Transcobalamin-like C-terminal domain-containing protein n=1 Tax=Secundilactobacillus odoratitofui DSM 19909 = JCM 15043 TaxID=1423776 RepID=A0A0R1M0D9_9LACO|nr:DUF4430 domain-containing protein [Secundilactobacillus odoratitofui]KRK98585.1 hypothetical protein FD04_GL000317 [Secundilactobacillus odoratitofui DSM 19909 = JCM 15043]
MTFKTITKTLTGIALLSLGLALGSTNIAGYPATAQAKTKSTRVVKVTYKKLAKNSYSVAKGNFYQTSYLKKVTHYAKNYPHTTFYTYTQATVTRANGKHAIYDHVKSKNGKVNGWIWHGYLKQRHSVVTPKAPITALVGTETTNTATSNATSQAEQVQVQVFGPVLQGNKVLASGTVTITDGDTAFTVLQKLGVPLSYTGTGGSLYVSGIDGMSAGSGGANGGWLYSVNGVIPNYSAGTYKVKDGDIVQWLWTQTLGDR